MGDKLRWGILGASKFARQHMGPAIEQARNAELTLLATPDPKKANAFHKFAPDLEVCDSYDAVLDDNRIDAVYLPLPNHLHVDWTKRAIAAGKHVLCEKPIGLQVEDIDELITHRDAAGTVVAEAFMIVHHPQWSSIRELLADGAIGDLQHVDAVFCYNNPDPRNIRNRAETGGGGLRDIGVYTIGATRWASGQEPVAITNARFDLENGVDVVARATAQFDGFTAAWATSMRMSACQEVTFYGDAGSLTATVPFNPTLERPATVELIRGSTRDVLRFSNVAQYVSQVETFGRAAQQGDRFPWELEDARGTQAVIDEIFAVAQRAG